MAEIFPGRYTAKTDQPFVVFLIGMRINRFWDFRAWLPVARAMAPMIRTLYQHPEKGFLGGYTALGPGGPVTVQFWRSFADLERFARSPSDPHLPAWQAFYKAGKGSGSGRSSVGIWHETYVVQPGNFEALYSGMPRFGLGSVMEHVQVTESRNSARQRLREQTAVPAD